MRLRAFPFLTLALLFPLFASEYPLLALPPITNGVETKAGEFPAIVELTLKTPKGMWTFTGTIIGPNTVLTSAHFAYFLEDGDSQTPDIAVSIPGEGEVRAVDYFCHPKFDIKKIHAISDEMDKLDLGASKSEEAEKELIVRYGKLEQYDLCVLKLPAHPRRLYVPLKIYRNASDLLKMPVTLVGFGANDETARFFDGKGVQRKGANRVRSTWEGLIITVGIKRDRVYRLGGLMTKPDGQDAGMGHGDSGGPLLTEGGIIAVNEGIGEGVKSMQEVFDKGGAGLSEEREIFLSASLSDPENIHFLKSAQDRGFLIAWTDAPATGIDSRLKKKESTTLQQLQERKLGGFH